jgi:hypothetical protein
MRMHHAGSLLFTCALVGTMLMPASAAQRAVKFTMLVSAGAASCLPDARADVTIYPRGGAEVMDVVVSGLPANTDFNLFVIQVPTSPFGMSWYQGDIRTAGTGRGRQRFMGRFNNETFVVAPGAASAPVLHAADASQNPATSPLHMFHLGLWFDSPADAVKANCPGTTTPFNGDHTAGIQVLNTSNFPNDSGPLRQVGP